MPRIVALPTRLVAVVTSLLVLGFAPGVARAQVPIDLGDAIEQTQGTLGDITDQTLGLLPSTDAPGEEGSSGAGGAERGPVEPPPLDPQSVPAPAPPPASPNETVGSDPEAAPDPAPAGPQGSVDREARSPDRGSAGGDRRSVSSNGSPRVAPSPGARRPQESTQTTLERIVSVVPTEIKVTLAILVLLVLGSLLTGRRVRRRLAQAERRAATDPLTGLPNRTSAEEALERLVALGRRSGRPVSAALFDLDHFKAVNDTYGHAAGDEALREVANAVRARVRGGDHVARFGGEEFLLMLPDTDRDGAVTIAEILRSAISELEIDGPGTVTASFGVAAMPADATSSADLIGAADRALYAAKGGGRDRVETAGGAPATLETVA